MPLPSDQAERDALMRSIIDEGRDNEAVATELGVNVGTVRKAVRMYKIKNGIPFPRRNRKPAGEPTATHPTTAPTKMEMTLAAKLTDTEKVLEEAQQGYSDTHRENSALKERLIASEAERKRMTEQWGEQLRRNSELQKAVEDAQDATTRAHSLRRSAEHERAAADLRLARAMGYIDRINDERAPRLVAGPDFEDY